MSVADSYQRCWACQFRIPRLHTWWKSSVFILNTVSCKQKQNKTTCLFSLWFWVITLPPPVKYQIRAAQQLPKISWTGALVLIFGDLQAAARAVSLCRTCDTVTWGHCQAGMSQRVLCYADRNSETVSEWETHCRLVFLELSCWDLKGLRHFQLVAYFKKRGEEGCMVRQMKIVSNGMRQNKVKVRE